MTLAALELAFRSAAVALLLVLAASLLSDFRNVLAARLGAAFALGSAAHAASYSVGVSSLVPARHAPLIALSTGNIVVFWLFTRALFDDEFRLRWWRGSIWALVTALSFVGCLWIAPGGNVRFSVTMVNLIVLGFIALAVVQTIASWSADLVERRRRVRVFIVCAAALYGGLNAVLQIFVAGSDAGDFANTINAGVLACIVAAIAYAMLRVDGTDLFPVAAETAPAIVFSQPAADDTADQKLIDALMRLTADERIYRHENITIGVCGPAENSGIPAAPADQPAARLPQLQRFPEQPPHRGGQGCAGRSRAGRGARHHHRDGCRLPVARPLQPRLQDAVTGVTPTEYRRLNANAV